MMIKSAMSLALAAACLATIAITPAAAGEAARQTVTVKHPPIVNPGDVSEPWSARQNVIKVSITSGCWRQIPLSAKRGCERSVARSPIRNSVIAALQASTRMSRTLVRRQRRGTTGAMPVVKVSARL